MPIRPLAFGALVGLVIAVALYVTTPAYAAFINWQFQNPLVLIPAAFVGIAAAWIFD